MQNDLFQTLFFEKDLSFEYFLFKEISSNKSLIINGEDNLRISFKFFKRFSQKTKQEKEALPAQGQMGSMQIAERTNGGKHNMRCTFTQTNRIIFGQFRPNSFV